MLRSRTPRSSHDDCELFFSCGLGDFCCTPYSKLRRAQEVRSITRPSHPVGNLNAFALQKTNGILTVLENACQTHLHIFYLRPGSGMICFATVWTWKNSRPHLVGGGSGLGKPATLAIVEDSWAGGITGDQAELICFKCPDQD